MSSPAILTAQRLGLEPGAVAHLAGLRGLVLAQLLAHPRAVGREHAALEVADHALERLVDLVGLAPVDEAQRHRAALRCREDQRALLVGQLAPRRVESKPRRGEAGEHLHVIGRGRVGLRPRHHRALLDREFSLGTTSAGSKDSFSPRPSHAGQAPCGALNENSRGSISAMVKPETGQANFSRRRCDRRATACPRSAARACPRSLDAASASSAASRPARHDST